MFSIFLLAFLSAPTTLPSNFNQPRPIHVATPQPESGPLTVVTWNLDRGTELSRQIEELKAHPAAIILLQEVDWNVRRSGKKDETSELAHVLNMNAIFGIEFEELSQEEGRPAYIGQATLTDLPLHNSRVLRFKHQSNFWQPHSWIPNLAVMQRREGSRMALVTEAVYNGERLVIYNVHLESRSYGKIQMRQLDEILLDMKAYPKGTAFLLAGDLNTKYFPSVYLRKLQREGFQNAMGNRTPITHDIPSSLDWIFAKGVPIGQGRVHRDMKGSDHYPVYAVIGAPKETE